MKLVTISVGRPREVQWHGRSVQTSIFKTPVLSRVHVTRGNIEGDRQSDLSHAAENQAWPPFDNWSAMLMPPRP